MSSIIINAKGQIALPEDIVSHLGLRRGDQLIADKLPGGRIEVRVFRPTGKISSTFGGLKAKRRGRALTIDEMNKIIADGWAGKH
jgi:bifunctional DNA-binding transcriptional regulator/antitoxin component of YhaV-PrlF toxin-antitoxin module